MAIIKGITRLVMPAATKGMPEVVTYIKEKAWNSSTTDIVEVGNVLPFGTIGGLSDPPSFPYQPGGLPYLQPILQVTVTSSSIVLPMTDSAANNDPLKAWYNPSGTPIRAWFLIGAEVIEYTDIEPANTSSSGYDEFHLATTAYRGQFSSTAAGHTAPLTIGGPITGGIVEDIEYDTDIGVFTVRTKHTLMQDQDEVYGADGWQEAAVTYVSNGIPQEQVYVYQTISGYTNYA